MSITKRPAPRFITSEGMLVMDEEWRKADRHRPDNELRKIWVVYQWSGERWELAGFRRRRQLRKKQTFNKLFAKVRRRLQIDKTVEIMLMDLATAQALARGDSAWQVQPPARRAPRQPRHLPIESVGPVPMARQPKRRAPQRAARYHKRRHLYVALGRRRFGERQDGYLYLGPLASATFGQARKEADKLFGVVYDTIVLETEQMSKRLRNRIHRGTRVIAGQTRLLWPEPLEIEDMLTLPRVDAVTEVNLRYLMEKATHDLKRAIKTERSTDIVHALAVLTFLESFNV